MSLAEAIFGHWWKRWEFMPWTYRASDGVVQWRSECRFCEAVRTYNSAAELKYLPSGTLVTAEYPPC